jgi:glycosyltransferase involved in cell wall biosynthesis
MTLLGSVGASDTERDAIAAFRARYADVRLGPVVVVIAAYQEETTIGRVLDELPTESCGLDVEPLVVVDGATDGTARAAIAKGARVCELATNQGQGTALRLGYHLAATGGASIIATTDADGQYDSAELPVLIRPIVDGGADFVTGSRWLGRNQTASTTRRIGSHLFAYLVTVLTRHKVTDTSFGFRAMTPAVVDAVELRQPQYQSSELLIGALMLGFRVVEVPMTMRTRLGGKTKKGNSLVYGSRYARVVLGTWVRERSRRRASGRVRALSEHEAVEEHELRDEHHERSSEVRRADQHASERDRVRQRIGDTAGSGSERHRQQ